MLLDYVRFSSQHPTGPLFAPRSEWCTTDSALATRGSRTGMLAVMIRRALCPITRSCQSPGALTSFSQLYCFLCATRHKRFGTLYCIRDGSHALYVHRESICKMVGFTITLREDWEFHKLPCRLEPSSHSQSDIVRTCLWSMQLLIAAGLFVTFVRPRRPPTCKQLSRSTKFVWIWIRANLAVCNSISEAFARLAGPVEGRRLMQVLSDTRSQRRRKKWKDEDFRSSCFIRVKFLVRIQDRPLT